MLVNATSIILVAYNQIVNGTPKKKTLIWLNLYDHIYIVIYMGGSIHNYV